MGIVRKLYMAKDLLSSVFYLGKRDGAVRLVSRLSGYEVRVTMTGVYILYFVLCFSVELN